MGQRSQIYVIAKKNNEYYMTANYYQWNYGERMISRVRGTLEQIIDDYIKNIPTELKKQKIWGLCDLQVRIVRIFTA